MLGRHLLYPYTRSQILQHVELGKELQNFVTNNVFLDKQFKHNKYKTNNIKYKNPCRSQKLNPGPLAPKADALPLHQRNGS